MHRIDLTKTNEVLSSLIKAMEGKNPTEVKKIINEYPQLLKKFPGLKEAISKNTTIKPLESDLFNLAQNREVDLNKTNSLLENLIKALGG